MAIKDLNVDESFVEFFVLKSSIVKQSTNGKNFLDMTLSDASGEVNAKHWDPQTSDMELKAGDIVKVKGIMKLWMNASQIKIEKMRLVTDADEYDVLKLIKSAPIPPKEMLSEIDAFIEKISDEGLKTLVKTIFKRVEKELVYYPAAKANHHSIKSGLLYHLVRMLRTADALCNIYGHLNRDLVFVGVLLHDIEKIHEMYSNEYGIVESYTTEGQLLGHIVMGIKLVDRVSREIGLDEEKSLLVQHIILSHHYEPEFGSPVKPLIPEGELLHYIDIIDARVYDFDNVQSTLEKGSFSEPVFVLDKRRVYKPKF